VSGVDGKILPAPETIEIAGFVIFRPVINREKKIALSFVAYNYLQIMVC